MRVGAAAGNAAAVQTKVAAVQQPVTRADWFTAHQKEIDAVPGARKRLTAMDMKATAEQMQAAFDDLASRGRQKPLTNPPRSTWAEEMGLGRTSRDARTLGLDSIGKIGGKNVHLTLYRDDDRRLDVSLGFDELFKNVLQQDTKPPLHASVELYGKDATANPRAYWSAAGTPVVHGVSQDAAEALKTTTDKAEAELQKLVKDQAERARGALKPHYTRRGGTD